MTNRQLNSGPAILLLDNGSLEPAATISLRRIAASLELVAGRRVEPVSLLHSSAISPAELGGRRAEILEPALSRRAESGVERFLVLPLFFGPSSALTKYLPERVAALRTRHLRLTVQVSPSLVDSRAESADCVAAMLEDHVRQRMIGLVEAPAVVVVDHGSPVREVVAVRDRVAERLRLRLAGVVTGVRAASMERRPGPEYEFGEPMLDQTLGGPGYEDGVVIVAMMFVSPGRHAGPGGDVARICEAAELRCPRLKTVMTDLVGTHPGLVRVLAERVRDGLSSVPI